MARMLFALTIALAAHGLLLVVSLPPSQTQPFRQPVRTVTISLGYRHREPPAVEPPQIEAQQPIPPAPAPRKVQPRPAEQKPRVIPIKKNIPRPPPEPKAPEGAEPLDKPRETVSVPPETAEAVGGVLEPDTGQVVREATPLYRVNRPPPYPSLARRQGYAGTVTLEVLVDRRGRVSDLRVFSSSGYTLLDKAALAAVKNYLFEPGRRGDESVDMWVRVPIRFVLE